jgi:hypothetical protein
MWLWSELAPADALLPSVLADGLKIHSNIGFCDLIAPDPAGRPGWDGTLQRDHFAIAV